MDPLVRLRSLCLSYATAMRVLRYRTLDAPGRQGNGSSGHSRTVPSAADFADSLRALDKLKCHVDANPHLDTDAYRAFLLNPLSADIP